MTPRRTDGVRVELWAKGASTWGWWSENLTFYPQIGEIVHFEDGLGVVETVEWIPDLKGSGPLKIKATCVPKP